MSTETAPQQSAPQQADAPATTNGPSTSTFEQRLDAVWKDIRAEQGATSQPAAEQAPAGTPAAGNEPPPAAQAVPGSAADSDAVTKAREERRARLEALQAQEREKVDAKARLRERDQLAERLAAAEKRAEEAQRIAAQRIDIEGLDEAKFFEYAERAKVTPQRLGEWLRDRIANPALAASDAAKKAVDPEIAALRRELADSKAQVEQFLAMQAQQSAEAQERAAEQTLISAATAEATPYSHKFLSAFGHEEFLKVARGAAQTLPPGSGSQALFDVIEDQLEKLASIYMPQATTPAAKSNGKQTPPQKPAAAKATTVSNSIAQERASVVEESDFAKLPFDERVKRLKAAM